MATKVVLFSVIVFLVGLIAAIGQEHQAEGDKPYTPTRREWIEMELNANWHPDLTADKFNMVFVSPKNEVDTIVIFVNYLPTVERQIMKERIEAVKKAIATETKYRGWSWLKIREQVEMYESK
jgi:hypothetical protein